MVPKTTKTSSRFKLPSRRAVASLALVSVLTAVENQRSRKAVQPAEEELWEDMSGELQTIPARHGVATFVPRGRTIKVINTYGKQVVSTWAFSLHAPPQEGDSGGEEVGEEKIEKQAEELKEQVAQEEQKVEGEVEESEPQVENSEQGPKDATEDSKEEAEDPPEQAPETPENEKTTENTEEKKQAQKRTWASYLPTIPYRNKGAGSTQTDAETQKAEKAENEAQSKAWSSYLPTGKGFSTYIPNVQIPDRESMISAFKQSHYRDLNKSYAEQLYDFSKTPVGAGTIAVASGSGTASSLYAAYNAYSQMNLRSAGQPPMEYLSLPHTRSTTHRLVPQVDDTLLSNLRNPIMTLVEDTTPGAHDTLTAACDASQYTFLGIDKPEEHGSCAENLVLALKELNEKAGLKGTKAVGAEITVNIAPTPLHLFMNAPIDFDSSAQDDGSGAKGASIKIDEPTGKKRSYVRFRAERDIVIVMSACPMDVGKQNGGKCMAANFMVEEPSEEDMAASTASLKKKQKASQPSSPKQEEEKPKPMPRPRGGPAKIQGVMQSAKREESPAEPAPAVEQPKQEEKEEKEEEVNVEESPKPKKKPKKLERRTGGAAT
ncbi:hypothetical protein EJ04DRAFT_453899, partial [Polyplosphaeria fusca]